MQSVGRRVTGQTKALRGLFGDDAEALASAYDAFFHHTPDERRRFTIEKDIVFAHWVEQRTGARVTPKALQHYRSELGVVAFNKAPRAQEPTPASEPPPRFAGEDLFDLVPTNGHKRVAPQPPAAPRDPLGIGLAGTLEIRLSVNGAEYEGVLALAR